MRPALVVVLLLGLIGVASSSYLCYAELVAGGVPGARADGILGVPACVYGSVVFTAIVFAAGAGLWRGARRAAR